MFGQTGNPLSRFYKLGAGFVRFFRSPRDPRYRDTLQSFLAHRESNFLSVVQKVLAKTGHPYAQLFGIAGCSYADLEAGVRENGLESTLEALLREGVYLSLDEFRGKAEIVRGGRHIAATTADWDLARGQNAIEATSSGSSGGRTFRTSHGLEVANLGLASARLFLGEVMRRDAAIVTVAPILPSTLGLLSCIGSIRLGYRDEKWFAFGGSLLANGHYRAITSVIVSALRAAGAKVPYPTYLTKDDFSPAAEYVAARKKQGVPIALHGMVSAAARVAGAAIDRGLDVRGTVAVVTGETLTDSKRELIESAGIEVFPIYTTSDFGQIGVPCHEMNSGDCVHIAMPSVALVARPAPSLWGDGELLNSLHVTSVLPFAPRVLINVEMGDTGIIELATCDCEFSRLGYKLRVRDIAAIGKLTTQGCTLYAPEMIRLLEEELPARFGGRAGDYQLMEVEGRGQSELVLGIHPRLGTLSSNEVLEYFMVRFRKVYGGALASLQWTESNGIRAEIKEPFLPQSGKFRAVRLLSSPAAAAKAASQTAATQS